MPTRESILDLVNAVLPLKKWVSSQLAPAKFLIFECYDDVRGSIIYRTTYPLPYHGAGKSNVTNNRKKKQIALFTKTFTQGKVMIKANSKHHVRFILHFGQSTYA